MANNTPDPMDVIKQTFFQECEEQLAELESGLLAMQSGDSDPETVNAVFRAVHSVKGGAGAFALDALVRFAHVFETALDKLRSDRSTPEPAVLMVMLRAADVLADLVRAYRDNKVVEDVHSATSAAELEALVNPVASPATASPAAASPAALVPQLAMPQADPDGMDGLDFQPIPFAVDGFVDPAAVDVPEAAEAAEAGADWSIRFRPHAALYAKANEATVLLRELSRLGPIDVTLDASGLPALADLDPEGAYLSWTIQLHTDEPESAIREVFDFVDGDCELDVALVAVEAAPVAASDEVDVMALIQRATTANAAAPVEVAPSTPVIENLIESVNPTQGRRDETAHTAKPTIRVDLDRVDRLIDLVGELVINQAMLAQRVLESGLSRSSNVAMGLEELEQLTREIQDSVMAIRAQPVKSVFQRLPRLARELAVMTGKQVRLVTEGEGTEVDKTVIEHLSDPLTHMIRNAIDHGVERPDVRVAKGKPAEGTVRLAALHRSGRIVIEIADDGAGINRPRVRSSAVEKGLIAADAVLTDDEIDNLIFLPGFSTAETISDISGRGVGMDVVRRSIQSLGGRISIASRPGLGSTFTMSLPLTLAVLDGMVVTVEGETMIVPLTAIIETLQPKASDIFDLGGGARVIGIRGSYVPLLDVGCSLGYRARPPQTQNCVALLIEGEGGVRAALLVDVIQGQRQVVIKSLEANYRHVPGVAAATILGDGRVALILDIDAIAASARAEGSLQETGAVYA